MRWRVLILIFLFFECTSNAPNSNVYVANDEDIEYLANIEEKDFVEHRKIENPVQTTELVHEKQNKQEDQEKDLRRKLNEENEQLLTRQSFRDAIDLIDDAPEHEQAIPDSIPLEVSIEHLDEEADENNEEEDKNTEEYADDSFRFQINSASGDHPTTSSIVDHQNHLKSTDHQSIDFDESTNSNARNRRHSKHPRLHHTPSAKQKTDTIEIEPAYLEDVEFSIQNAELEPAPTLPRGVVVHIPNDRSSKYYQTESVGDDDSMNAHIESNGEKSMTKIASVIQRKGNHKGAHKKPKHQRKVKQETNQKLKKIKDVVNRSNVDFKWAETLELLSAEIAKLQNSTESLQNSTRKVEEKIKGDNSLLIGTLSIVALIVLIVGMYKCKDCIAKYLRNRDERTYSLMDNMDHKKLSRLEKVRNAISKIYRPEKRNRVELTDLSSTGSDEDEEVNN